MEIEDLKHKILRLLKEDEEFRYAVAGLIGLDEVLRRLDKHSEELVKLREDMNKLREDMNRGFKLIERHITALGARWGIMAEESFREGLRGILSKELGLKVERWRSFDEDGYVYGYPSEVEVDIAIKDEKIILIEISSHVKPSDVYQFKRKSEIYERKTGKKSDRLLMVTPYADEKALEASMRLGVEIYTEV